MDGDRAGLTVGSLALLVPLARMFGGRWNTRCLPREATNAKRQVALNTHKLEERQRSKRVGLRFETAPHRVGPAIYHYLLLQQRISLSSARIQQLRNAGISGEGTQGKGWDRASSVERAGGRVGARLQGTRGQG